MSLTPKDVDALRKHFLDNVKNRFCPKCGSECFGIDGPMALVRLHPQSETLIVADLNNTAPLVIVVCQECFHVDLFAWKPIEDAMETGKDTNLLLKS